MGYKHFKHLKRRTASNKILCDKAFNIAKNPKYDEYQCGLASMVWKFFDKKSFLPDKFKYENISNKELAEELHKPIIKKNKKKNTLTFYRQVLENKYAIKKQIQ